MYPGTTYSTRLFCSYSGMYPGYLPEYPGYLPGTYFTIYGGTYSSRNQKQILIHVGMVKIG